ncbi:MAG: hypothetical protein WC551_03875 [Patescibacteria group bacterium]
MLQKNSVKQPAFLMAGVLFTLIALVALAALLVLKSKADTATQQANTGNTAPALDSLIVSDTSGSGDVGPAGSGSGFTTNEGAAKTLYVRGQATDLNGCSDLQDVKITVYRSGATGADACTPDMNDCYTVTLLPADFDAGCGVGVNTVTFETSFSFANFVDPSDAGSPYDAQTWLAKGVVKDNVNATHELTPDFEVNSMAAFSVPGAINYGAVGLGQDSNAIGLTFSNTGNRAVDAEVIALVDPVHQPEPLVGDMTSNLTGFADIAASAVHYSLTSGFTYGTGDTAVSKLASTALALDLAQQTDDLVVPTVDTYWKLRVPSTGVNGTYTNTLVFTAVAGSTGLPLAMAQRSMVDYSGTIGVGKSVVSGNYAYIASDYAASAVTVVDYTDLENPSTVATINSALQNPSGMVVSGNYLYLVANGINDFQIINISNPAAPSISSTISACSGQNYSGSPSIAIKGSYAYITCTDDANNFKVVNITNPASPAVFSGTVFNGDIGGVQIFGNFAYIYSSVGGKDGSVTTIKAINISDPAEPWTSINYSVGAIVSGEKEFRLSADGTYAYVSGGGEESNTLQILNVANPSAMSEVSTLAVNSNSAVAMAFSGDYVYVSDYGEVPGSYNLSAIDVSTPATPTVVGAMQIGVLEAAYGLYASDQNIYVSAFDAGKYYVVTAGTPAAAAPVINSLNPSVRFVNSGGFTLLVEGENFQGSDSIVWDGLPRETIWISSTQMETLINAEDLTVAGTVDVKVTTAGEVDSNTVQFTIMPPG